MPKARVLKDGTNDVMVIRRLEHVLNAFLPVKWMLKLCMLKELARIGAKTTHPCGSDVIYKG